MVENPDSLTLFRRLLLRPDASFPEALSIATGASGWPIEVVQQLAAFGERVRDLSVDELQELHDETFARQPTAPASPRGRRLRWPEASQVDSDEWRHVSEWLQGTDAMTFKQGAPSESLLAALGSLQGALMQARNPYHHVLAALAGFLDLRGLS
jgi:nitrate reductase assembly molybdenum cofactor insertion protein NarJ